MNELNIWFEFSARKLNSCRRKTERPTHSLANQMGNKTKNYVKHFYWLLYISLELE